jgi:copper(I)-binding protein
VTGSRPRIRPPGQGRLRGLAVAGTAGAVIALAACGSQPSASPASDGPGTAAAQSDAPAGTTTRIADSMDVINARIPASAAGSATAQVEVTLADTSTAGPDTLLAATSPVARAVVFTSNGHAVPRITIPVAAGSSLSTGPPHPDRILLTGLRHQLRTGQTVSISLVFAVAGHATFQVPVVEPTP